MDTPPKKSSECKVLLLQDTLMPYRIPIYKMIGEQCDLTVGFIRKKNIIALNPLKTKQLDCIKIGRFFWIKSFYQLCNKFDIIIVLPHFQVLSYILINFVPRKFKIITWSMGVRASYKKPYSLTPEKNILFRIYFWIQKKADACIFYTKQPIPMWKSLGLDEKKCFVAHNTVKIADYDSSSKEKDSLLFVGTLYKQKKIDELIDAYLEAKDDQEFFPILRIVGSGDDLERVQNKYKSNSIEFLGAIFDETELAVLFSKAYACISPGQAGLSVLKSMGYGVPFITRYNAITGGEIFNIKNNENGFLYNTKEELISLLKDINNHPDKYIRAGVAAKEYYKTNASPQKMVSGVIDAINYSILSKDK